MIKLFAPFVLASLAFSAQAADKLDWKSCEKEVKEFKCSGEDKAVWSCLEKYDDKLSAGCQKVHAAGDKVFGK